MKKNFLEIKVKFQNVFRTASISVFAFFLFFSFLGLIFLYYLTSTLPDVSKLKSFQHVQATEVFSDEGKKIGEFTTERRYPFVFDSLPKYLIQSFLAAEDAKFYEHNGVDFNGIGRAVFSNVTRGRFAQGGSTITQQVARALLLSTKKKEITRKIREIVLAWRMEKTLSKNEILNLYLKEIFLGHGSFGVASAARNYFGKKVEQLTLGEASMLAGLPQRPNEWNPIRNPHLAKRRQAYVLKRMVEEKFISAQQSQDAYNEVLKLRNLEDLNNSAAPYFTEYVRQYLMAKYGSEHVLSQGYRVYTTVNYEFQKTAEKAVDRGLREVDKRLGWRGITEHIEEPVNQEAFVRNAHKTVVEELNPPRLLYPDAASGVRGLEYDLTPYYEKSSRYFGATPVSEGGLYKGLVAEVRDDKNAAFIRVGQTSLALPIAGVQWAKIDGMPIKQLSQILKQGDVIWVRVEKIDKKSGYASVALEQEPEVQGALLSYEVQNGFVRAMVGGTDFNKSKFNCALQAKRQVGSTFKPLLYAAAFDKGFSPASLVTDSPIVYKTEGKTESQTLGSTEEEWKPHNYGNKFEGDIPLRTAIIRSMNIPTVKLLNEIGVDYGIQYSRTLGITSQLPRDLTIGLGSWSSSLEELMRAYAIFPRLGRPVALKYIKRVEDSDGKVIEAFSDVADTNGSVSNAMEKNNEGPALLGNSKVDGQSVGGQGETAVLPPGHVISPQTAYVMTDLLKGVIRDPQGTGHAAGSVARQIAGKTGTSNDHRDAWFIGYTPTLMSGVWIGYLKDKTLDIGETGGKAAAPIWADYMRVATAQSPNIDFPIPDDVVFAYIDRNTGKLAGPGTPTRVRVAFKAGTVPNANGDNLLRVGEPGVRGTATGSPGGKIQTSPTTEEPTKPSMDESETSDFMRQEFQ
jgi:penicillin-binding protein 1A